MAPRVHTLGVISDTHGLVRPEALAALAGVERIVHAGDIGAPDVLDALGRIAPVTAVRGNNDRERWAADIPETDVLEIGEVSLYVLHDLHELDLDPRAAGFSGPRVFAIVKVGGHRIFSILIDADPARVAIGQRVRLKPLAVEPDPKGNPRWLPAFTPSA